jgi:hypothetical protein
MLVFLHWHNRRLLFMLDNYLLKCQSFATHREGSRETLTCRSDKRQVPLRQCLDFHNQSFVRG